MLLTEAGLPDLRGDLLIKHVTATARRRPWIVVVTSYGEPVISRACEVGADVVLTKPLEWSRLLERLVPMLAARRAA
jgi:DNA-binding response OmpR family regulator